MAGDSHLVVSAILAITSHLGQPMGDDSGLSADLLPPPLHARARGDHPLPRLNTENSSANGRYGGGGRGEDGIEVKEIGLDGMG